MHYCDVPIQCLLRRNFLEGWSRKSEKILTIEFILSFGKL